MSSTSHLSDGDRRALVTRLRRIEGQARGVARMIDEGRDCLDVLTQIAAVRAATDALAAELLEEVAIRCLRHPESFESPELAVEETLHALARVAR